jgi:hypothetical protein|nr:MAG TPA: hypothetical protein [Caudoviricetes sp.]
MDKKKESADNGALHSTEDDAQYFVIGKVRIKISEHFAKEGKPFTSLLEDVILHAVAAS